MERENAVWSLLVSDWSIKFWFSIGQRGQRSVKALSPGQSLPKR